MKTKKWISTVLMFTLVTSLFSMSGCSFFQSPNDSNEPAVEARKGASRAAREVMEAIDELGTVTLQSEDAIIAAEALYDALTEEEKEEVSNYDILTAARSAFDQLKMQDFAADYFIQAKAAFLYPESVSLNHVYVAKAEEDGTYYFTYDVTVQNIVGVEEQRVYGNAVPVALNDESLASLKQNIALASLIGNQYWQPNCWVENGQELSAAAIQADYKASF